MKTHHILIIAALSIFTVSLPLFSIMRAIEKLNVECTYTFPKLTTEL